MVSEAHCMSFPCIELVLFNYAKVKRVPLTYLYNKLFKTCILPFNFEHPVI